MKKIMTTGLVLVLVLTMSTMVMAGSVPDVPAEHWAHDAVSTTFGEGIFIGYPDGTFKGDFYITRYEIAMVMERLLERMDEMLVEDEQARSDLQDLRTRFYQITGDMWVLEEEITDLQQIRASLTDMKVIIASLEEETADLQQIRSEVQSLHDTVAGLERAPEERELEERELFGVRERVPVGQRPPYTSIPWSEYSPPVSRFTGLDLSASYRYFDDQSKDDEDNINHGDLKLEYWRFRDGPEAGYDINLQLNANTVGDTDLNYNAGGRSGYKRYFNPERNHFYYGGLNVGASSAYDGLSMMLSAGLGTGRYTDVTSLGRAAQIERELIEIGDIRQSLGRNNLLSLASEIERRVDVEETTSERAQRTAEILEGLDPAVYEPSVEGVLEIRDILDEPSRRRMHGWEVRGGVGYPLMVPDDTTRTANLVAEAGLGLPISYSTQLNASAQISTPFSDIGDEVIFGVRSNIVHDLTESITLGADLGYDLLRHEAGTDYSWSLGASGDFQIQKNLSLISSVKLTDSSKFEEETVDFRTALSYRIF